MRSGERQGRALPWVLEGAWPALQISDFWIPNRENKFLFVATPIVAVGYSSHKKQIHLNSVCPQNLVVSFIEFFGFLLYPYLTSNYHQTNSVAG